MSLLLLLQSPAAAAADPVLQSPRNVYLETLEYVRATTPKAAAALLILLAPAAEQTGSLTASLDGLTLASTASTEITGTTSATLDGLTLSAQADAVAAVTDTVLTRTVNVTGDVETYLPKRRPTLTLLEVPPGGGALTATLDGVTLTASGSAPISASATVPIDGLTISAQGGVQLAPIEASLTASLGGLTLQTDGTLGTPAAAPAQIRKTVNVTAEDATFYPKRKLPFLFPSPPGGVLTASLDGLTIASTASVESGTPVPVDAIRQPTRNVLGEEWTQLAKRKPVTALLLSPLPMGAQFNNALGGITLAADASVQDGAWDVYLCGETRAEAFPRSQVQTPRKRSDLLTTFNYPVITGAFDTTLSGLTLTSVAVQTAPSSGDLTATLVGLTLSSQSVIPVTGTFTATLDGITLDSDGSEIGTNAGRLTASLGGLTLSSQAASLVEAQASIALDGIRLTAWDIQPNAFAVADVTLGGVTLASQATVGVITAPTGRLVNVTGADRSTSTRRGRVVIVDDPDRDTKA